jgi:hypothetical protein
MHKSATKCNKTLGEWCKNKHGASKNIDTFETYHPRTPRNIQEVQASKLGDAPEAPLLHRQKSGHLSKHYIFIASCTMHFSWSVFTFAFSFLLLCLLQLMVGSHHVCFVGRYTLFFIAKNTLVFTLIVQRVFSFSATAFSFCFLP